MYTKTEIFRDIVNIMSEDYAGFLEKRHVNQPENYSIRDDMDDDDFVETVGSYLLDFKDGHLSFSKKSSSKPFKGFKVRRYLNTLYVTEVDGENRLEVGDRIVALDGRSIEEFGKEHYKILKDDNPERQDWNYALTRVNSIKYQRDNQMYEIDLKNFPKTPYSPEYSFRQLDPQTNYIKITDFTQQGPILKIVEENGKALNEAKNLIIDVRVNLGGSDLSYLPLLDYIFDNPIKFSALFEKDEISYINYTENNCKLWIANARKYMQQPLYEEAKQWIEQEIEKFQQNNGKGLLPVREVYDYVIQGRENPKNVYILSDVMCGSSGDTFVKHAKKSPKVTVVGRATMGILDYSNVVTKDYGEYVFGYATSKMHENYHCNETGVLPHIHVPWTPEHLKRDVDLDYVLELCKKMSVNMK